MDTYVIAAGYYPSTKITIHIYHSQWFSFKESDNILLDISLPDKVDVNWRVLALTTYYSTLYSYSCSEDANSIDVVCLYHYI